VIIFSQVERGPLGIEKKIENRINRKILKFKKPIFGLGTPKFETPVTWQTCRDLRATPNGEKILGFECTV